MNVNDELVRRYTVSSQKHRTEKHTSPSHWDFLLCEIHLDGKKIGEYVRNYSSFYSTFHPFEQDGKHYALYSKEYTATRVMTLPDCKDLCGEERDEFGFCPVRYAVPYFDYHWQGPPDPADPEPRSPQNDTTKWIQVVDKMYVRPGEKGYTLEHTKEEYETAIAEYKKLNHEWDERHPWRETPFNSQFGFVCGCVWGDDTSWKIQFLDLSRIQEGILVPIRDVGYLELLKASDDLACAIDVDYWTPENPYIRIASFKHYDTTKQATS